MSKRLDSAVTPLISFLQMRLKPWAQHPPLQWWYAQTYFKYDLPNMTLLHSAATYFGHLSWFWWQITLASANSLRTSIVVFVSRNNSYIHLAVSISPYLTRAIASRESNWIPSKSPRNKPVERARRSLAKCKRSTSVLYCVLCLWW